MDDRDKPRVERASRLRPDNSAVDRWRADVERREAEFAAEREARSGAQEHGAPDAAAEWQRAWDEWCQAHIEARLVIEREATMTAVGEEIAQLLAEQRTGIMRQVRDELRQLREETRELKIEVARLSSINAELCAARAGSRLAPMEIN
jgi:DNA repair exonuclease SbcCD ATPase subunit